ncbi:MAG: CRTAC homolog protein [Xenococcaceae cyanobacterium]
MNTNLSPLQDQTISQDSVIFEDLTQELGITYSRAESPSREAAYDEIRQQEVITQQDFVNTPLNSRGLPGVAILDYDSDGDLDIYVTNGPDAPNSLYSNQLEETGQFTFVDVAEEAGVTATDQDSSGVVYGDIDNDGDQDLLVLGTGEPNRLFENQGDGTFVDITEESGIGGGNKFSGSASFGDVNGDGFLDVVIGNTFTDWNDRVPVGGIVPFERTEHNQLFLNNGDNTFTDVSETSGIQNLASENLPPGAATITHAIAMVDYDLDGDIDIIHADDQGGVPQSDLGGSDRGVIYVLQNDGEGNFIDVTVESNLDVVGAWMGLSFGDFNADGNLDIFASNGGDYTSAAIGGQLEGQASSRWFLGQDDGTFEDPGVGELNATPFGWGTSTLDYENDGDTDIFFIGGHDLGMFVDASNPGALLQNDGNANFTYEPGVLDADHTRRNEKGSAVGDLNGDGFVDIVTVSNFNTPESIELEQYPNQFNSSFDATAQFVPTFTSTAPGEFVWNELELTDGTLSVEINSADNGNNFVEVDTLGTVGLTEDGVANRDGIGAVVSFTPEDGSTVMQPILGGSSYSSQDSLAANFGLGEQESGMIEVLWPGGVRNRLYDVPAGEKVVFPEIPVSFDGDFASQQEYEDLVRDALDELVEAEAITSEQSELFFSSAVRAFEEFQGENQETQLVFGTLENDELDVVDSNFDGDIVFGGAGDDLIDASVGSGNNRIYGQSGDDLLLAGTSDTLIAGDGNDTLFIVSGGDNVLSGGNGEDAFWIITGELPESSNTITDLEVGVDILGVAGVGASSTADLDFNQVGNHTTISFSGVELATVLNISISELEEDGVFTFA